MIRVWRIIALVVLLALSHVSAADHKSEQEVPPDMGAGHPNFQSSWSSTGPQQRQHQQQQQPAKGTGGALRERVAALEALAQEVHKQVLTDQQPHALLPLYDPVAVILAELVAIERRVVNRQVDGLDTTQLSRDAIILFGATQTAKTTLLHLINGIALYKKKRTTANGVLVVLLPDPKEAIGEVGDTGNSTTVFPNMRLLNSSLGFGSPTPVAVDLPGTKEKGFMMPTIIGLIQQGFISRFSKVKLVLCIAYSSVVDGAAGLAFTEEISDLSLAVGGLQSVKDSLAIVVTKCPPSVDPYVLDLARASIGNRMYDRRIADQPKDGEVLRHLLDHNRVQVFSDASLFKEGDQWSSPEGYNQAADIRYVIANNTRYTSLPRLRVSQSGSPVDQVASSFIKVVKQKLVELLGGQLDVALRLDEELLAIGDVGDFSADLKELPDWHGGSMTVAAFVQRFNRLFPVPLANSDEVRHAVDELILLQRIGVSEPVSHDWPAALQLSNKLQPIATTVKQIQDNSVQILTNRIVWDADSRTLTLLGYSVTSKEVALAAQDSFYTGVESIRVFAVELFVVDRDLLLPGVHVVVLAPRWSVPSASAASPRIINLSGRAPPAPPAQAATGRTGHNPSDEGGPGASGTLGENGHNAGNLLAIHRMSNSEWAIVAPLLQFQLDGGAGQQGQQGGQGGPGRDAGRDADIGTWEVVTAFGSVGIKLPHWLPPPDEWTSCYHGYHKRCDSVWRISAPAGGMGGSGGQGRQGGAGGAAGRLRIISISDHLIQDSTGFRASLSRGADGVDGPPGAGGLGGINGRWAEGMWLTDSQEGWNRHPGNPPHLVDMNGCSLDRAQLGCYTVRAKSGDSPGGMVPRSAAAPQTLQPSLFLTAVEYYAAFARYCNPQHSRLLLALVRGFHFNLTSGAQVRAELTLPALHASFQRLELLFRLQQQPPGLLPVYAELRDAIAAFASKDENGRWLHMAILSRTRQLLAQRSTSVVVDIKAFLQATLAEADSLESIELQKLVKDLKIAFNGQLQQRVSHAEVVVDKLSQDLQVAEAAVGAKIDGIIHEYERQVQDSELQVRLLESQVEEVERKMREQTILQIIGAVVSIVSLVLPVPIGPVVAGFVNFGLAMASNSGDLGQALGSLEALVKTAASAKSAPAPNFEIDGVLELAKAAASSIQKVSAGNQDLKQQLASLRNAIKTIREFVAGLRKLLESSFPDSIKGLSEQYADLQAAGRQSTPDLIHRRYEARLFFAQVREQVDAFTRGLTAQRDGLLDLFLRMQDVVDSSDDIYQHVEYLQDQQRLAEHLTAVYSVSIAPVLTPAQQELELLVRRNVIMELYAKAVNAVQLWAFPFGDQASTHPHMMIHRQYDLTFFYS